MRTPAGKECRYFYGNYFRGRKQEECRLLGTASPPIPWKPELCDTCPVPDIIRNNACQHMVLIPSLERAFPFIKKQVKVSTYCTHTNREGFDPNIGCGECHPVPPEFTVGS